MDAPLFPEQVPVPRGLVIDRTLCGLPPWAFTLVLLLAVGPLALWGRGTWWVSLLALGLGWGIGQVVQEDAQVLTAWMSEFRLKDYYE